ncbi:MAG: Hsp70 family protein [Pirellulaceae bacterium]|nr:Hsp70 family protein [Pirellulaceae bacterium]
MSSSAANTSGTVPRAPSARQTSATEAAPDFDAFEVQQSRYIVGIDLGTTNTAVAYTDTQSANTGQPTAGKQLAVKPFPVPQWVDFASREPREVLPSFHYEPTSEEADALAKIAGHKIEYLVGCLARDAGARQPGRQIASAKSWLCHDGVDRQSPLLPWHSDPGVTKLSPVTASSRTLAHIRQMWDDAHPQHPLAQQDVVLTLPASFDEVARQLTIEAARQAGLPRVLLVEEPQAAFYWWLHRHQASWEQIVAPGQTILVCDIGGGTTDFTLIRVRASTAQSSTQSTTTNIHAGQAAPTDAETLHPVNRQQLSLHRVAVGQHLILGGDNIDLALAKLVESQLPAGQKLNSRSWDILRSTARNAKEQLLGAAPPTQYSLAISSGGSRLIASQTRVELDVQSTQAQLLDGFFPQVAIDARPIEHHSGFQEFGLPYASDAAITKHLAAFLWDHRRAGRTDNEDLLSDLDAAKPDWVLFNGGVLASHQIRSRLLNVLGQWFTTTADHPWQPGVLENDRLDLAVACGAAYFGLVRRGLGVRIEAKLARSYYLVVSDSPPMAMYIVGGDASPGDKNRIQEPPLELAVGEPVQFPIVYSSTRLADRPGQLVEITAEEFTHLLPIRTVLQLPQRKRSDLLQVVLETELSEFGTLQLWCATPDGAQRWQLEFDVRSTTETDRDAVTSAGTQLGVVEHSLRAAAQTLFQQAFAVDGHSDTKVGSKVDVKIGSKIDARAADVTKQLPQVLGMPKHQWPPSLLRSMWQDLLELDQGRRQSATAEARWLNLLGYCLRPGYGMAADDWRVSQTWRTVYGKLAFASTSSRNESLILWRRIAGGFTAGQQMAVYQQVAGPLRNQLDPVRRAKGGAGSLQPAELIEMLRLVGSLELLPKSEKQQLGDWLLALVDNKRWHAAREAMLWTIGRLGNRVPTYGPLNTIVDTEAVEAWLEKLLLIQQRSSAWQLAILLCARLTGDRYRDIDAALRGSLVKQLASAPEHYRQLIEQGGQLAAEESSQIVGEALPLGLRTR